LRQRLRWALRVVTPWGIEWALMTRRARETLGDIDAEVLREAPPGHARVEEAVRFLLARGLDEHAVRLGSMPEASLHFVGELVSERLPSDRPVRALHVGNFLGVSLCYFTWLVRERHERSVVVSIDPNNEHRGIENPQIHSLSLLHHFGLLNDNLIISGYTLEQTLGEGGDDVGASYRKRLGCTNVLASLESLAGQVFDLVLLDGNHEPDYLAREFSALGPMLNEGAIVVLDDVNERRWGGVVEVFRDVLRDDRYVELGQDGRVGVLQVRRPTAHSEPVSTVRRGPLHAGSKHGPATARVEGPSPDRRV
jgi:hypothetical protein